MALDLGLEGKVVAISGSSRGIGKEAALRFAREGADVMLVARTAADLAATAELVRKAGGRRVETCATDLRSPQGCAAVLGALEATFGRLDVLVNNAGATQSGDFFKQPDELWEDGFALKFYSYMRLSRALWPFLKAAQGAVVNVIGAASKTPNQNFLIGGAVNAACTNFSKGLAGLGLRDGVRVNAIHPGPVLTDRLETLLGQRAELAGMTREQYEKHELAQAGVAAYARPEQVADLIAFMASPVSQQIVGADVFIDGGFTKTIL